MDKKKPNRKEDAAPEKQQAEQPAAQAATPDAPEIPETVTLTRDEFDQVKAHIDALSGEKAQLTEAAQRVQADFDNYRRRNATSMADSLDEGVRTTIKALLPVLDNFDRALDGLEEGQDGWKDGIALVHRQLMDQLTKCGLEEIRADGMFDPALHEAVMQEESDGKESGSILRVLQKGYKVKERIIRHSMVSVVK